MAWNELIQSNLRLQKGQLESQGAGAEGFAEGAQLITDQIDKNQKAEVQARKDELEIKRLEDLEKSREIAFDQQLTQATEKKNAYFDLLDEAHAKGLISKEVYTLSQEKREAWWKDQAKAHKHGADSAGLKKRMEKVLAGEQNWANAVKLSKAATISGSSAEAQKLDLAIEAYSRENGGTPPPVRNINGKDFFVIPYVDPVTGEESEVTVSVDIMSQEDLTEEGLFGAYDKITTMGSAINGFKESHADLIDRFNNNEATQNDVATIGRYYDQNINTPTKKREYANSVFTETSFDTEAFLEEYPNIDISGGDDPEKLDAGDIEMMDGKPGFSPEEDAILKQIFEDSITGDFDEEQQFNSPGYTSAEEAAYRTINTLDQDASAIHALSDVGLNYTINRGKGGDPTNLTVEIGGKTVTLEFQRDEEGKVIIDPASGMPKLTPGSITTLEGHIGYKNLDEFFPKENPTAVKDEETCTGSGHVWEGDKCRAKTKEEGEKEEADKKEAKKTCEDAGGTYGEDGTCKGDDDQEIDIELETKKKNCKGTWDDASGTCVDENGEEIVDQSSDDNEDVVKSDDGGSISSGDIEPGSVTHVSQIPEEQLWRMSPGAIEKATGVTMSADDRNLFNQHKSINKKLDTLGEDLEKETANKQVECSVDENSSACKQATRRLDKINQDIAHFEGVRADSRKDVVEKLQGNIETQSTLVEENEADWENYGCEENQSSSRCVTIKATITSAKAELEQLEARFNTYYK